MRDPESAAETSAAAAAAEARPRPRTAGREPHPLEGLGYRQLVRLAKRADRLRRRDVARFGDLAAQQLITPRQLRLLADAWDEGGRSGVDAIGPAPEDVDPLHLHRAELIVETWRRRHFPLDALETSVWRNRVTVYWMVLGRDRTRGLVRSPLMQLRRTTDGRWHLYRRAARGEWWPVTVRGRRRRQSLSACLDAVRVDPLNHFWGAAGPPRDLADGDGLPPLPFS